MPTPAFGVRFRALIASEWHHSARIRRCDRFAGELFTLTPVPCCTACDFLDTFMRVNQAASFCALARGAPMRS